MWYSVIGNSGLGSLAMWLQLDRMLLMVTADSLSVFFTGELGILKLFIELIFPNCFISEQ